MDTNQLARLIAGEAVSTYQSEYFNRVNATYNCVLDNFLSGTNRTGNPNIIFEFSVVSNDGAAGANMPGVSTKIIYSTENWNLKKVKIHLCEILGVPKSDWNDQDKMTQIVGEALEPRAEKDGKSILSGMNVVVTTTLKNDAAREAEGKPPYVVYRITGAVQDEKIPF